MDRRIPSLDSGRVESHADRMPVSSRGHHHFASTRRSMSSPESEMELDYLVDDDSLDGEVGHQMFGSQDRPLETEPPSNNEALRVQDAKTSDDVLVRYLDGLKQQMEKTFGNISTTLTKLDRKYVELAQHVQANSAGSVQASFPPRGVAAPDTAPNQNFLASSIANPELRNMVRRQGIGQDMKIDATVRNEFIPNSVGIGNLLRRPCDRTLGHSSRVEPYQIRKLDVVRFRPIEQKLENEEQFKYWKRSLIRQIDSQKCTFVIDSAEAPPPGISGYELGVVKRKVRHFILESLSPYFQDLVQDMSEPKGILDTLQNACDPSSTFQLKRLVDDFNSMHFDPKSEKAIEFLGRFDELRKKLDSINPNMLTPDYVKMIFELAISKTLTYHKAELHGFKFSIAELRDMLIEEQLRDDQGGSSGGLSYSIFRNRTAMSRGRDEAKRGGGGRGGYIPGQPKTAALRKTSTLSKPTKKSFCGYCKRRGHTVEACYRANKLCFKCGKSDKHFAADCPYPQKSDNLKTPDLSPQASSERSFQLGPTRNKASSETTKPKLLKMPLGQAKMIAQEFRVRQDSIFAIVGPTDGLDDSVEVWVTLGKEEEEHMNRLNFVSRRQE